MPKCSECGFSASEVFQQMHGQLMDISTNWAKSDSMDDWNRGQALGLLHGWYILACKLQFPARNMVFEEYKSMLFSSRRE